MYQTLCTCISIQHTDCLQTVQHIVFANTNAHIRSLAVSVVCVCARHKVSRCVSDYACSICDWLDIVGLSLCLRLAHLLQQTVVMHVSCRLLCYLNTMHTHVLPAACRMLRITCDYCLAVHSRCSFAGTTTSYMCNSLTNTQHSAESHVTFNFSEDSHKPLQDGSST